MELLLINCNQCLYQRNKTTLNEVREKIDLREALVKLHSTNSPSSWYIIGLQRLWIFVRAWTITELSSQYKTQLFITRPSVRVMIYPQVADNFCTIYLDQCNISSYYCFNALKSRHALKLLSSFKFIHTSIWWYFWMVRWGNDKRTFVSMHIIIVSLLLTNKTVNYLICLTTILKYIDEEFYSGIPVTVNESLICVINWSYIKP